MKIIIKFPELSRVRCIYHFIIGIWCGGFALASAALGETFSFTLYGNPGENAAIPGNISSYTVLFNGDFTIDDSVLGVPNAIILYRDPGFLSFDISLATAVRTYNFDLANSIDRFPGDTYPVNNTTTSDRVQGLRLDANGMPQRFDTPATSSGNGSEIREFAPNWGGGTRPELTLVDNDQFQLVEIAGGTLLDPSGLAGRTPVASFGGQWSFAAGQGDGASYSGIYQITPAPEPSTGVLLAMGVMGWFYRRPRFGASQGRVSID